MSKVLELKRPAISASAVERAEKLLARCRSGEVQGFTAVLEYVGGDYAEFGSGDQQQNLHGREVVGGSHWIYAFGHDAR